MGKVTTSRLAVDVVAVPGWGVPMIVVAPSHSS
jgi:hypothetical protein